MILVSVHVTSENPTPFDLEMKKLIEAGQLAEAKQLLSCTLGEEDSPWMHLDLSTLHQRLTTAHEVDCMLVDV